MIDGDDFKGRQMAQSLGLRWIAKIEEIEIDCKLIEHLPYRFAHKNAILPLKCTPDGAIDTLIADPLDIQSIEMARFLLKRPLILLTTSKQLLLQLIEKVYKEKTGSETPIENMGLAKKDDLLCLQKQIDFDDLPTSNLIDQSDRFSASWQLSDLLERAIAQRASDLHFEPSGDKWQVRYRIDGILHKRAQLPEELQRKINIRIKALAGLDIAESRRPQDGQFRMRLQRQEIDVRVSTILVEGGERLALRLFGQSPENLNLSSLHLPQNIESALRAQLKSSQGLLLVCGPTGSGKTTTLYSALGEIQREKDNIMTIEDPIEYRLQGISQMAVSPKIGLDFANGLRHLLRQDPDVILLGEMRDAASAQIAYRAALTGHLVLSTLHAKSAMGALMRLFELGIEPHILLSSLNGILYQRLVRQLCPHCKQSVEKDHRHNYRKLQKECFAVGCEKCHQTGYFGRRAVFEWLPIDQPHITPASMKSSSHRPALLAQSDQFAKGLIPLHQHALQLLDERVSSQKELERLL